jgi:hypothetical protein
MPFSMDFGIVASGMPSNTPASSEITRKAVNALILKADIITIRAAMHSSTIARVM